MSVLRSPKGKSNAHSSSVLFQPLSWILLPATAQESPPQHRQAHPEHSWGRVGRRWKDWEARRSGEGPSATWAGLSPRRFPFPPMAPSLPAAACPLGPYTRGSRELGVHVQRRGVCTRWEQMPIEGAAGADARGNWLWEGLRVGGVSGSRA